MLSIVSNDDDDDGISTYITKHNNKMVLKKQNKWIDTFYSIHLFIKMNSCYDYDYDY